MEKLYTIKDFMEITQLSLSTVLRRIKSGDLKASKLGRQWRIAESDLKDFIEGQ